MPDPIDELSRLGSTLEGGPMLPPEEIRRRGERIRRRTNALVATGSALAVAAVAVPVLALTGDGGGSGGADPADPRPGLSEADLLTDAETQYTAPEDPDGADWFTVDTSESESGSGSNPCARRSLSEAGATSVLERRFEMRGPDGATAPFNWMSEAVAEFGDAGSAREAYETLGDWVTTCQGDFPGESERATTRGPTPVGPGVAGDAEVYLTVFTPVGEEVDPFGELGYFVETGLILTGERIAVITSVIVGQDYNFMDGTPVERMIPAAAELLQPGETSGNDQPDADPGPTAIPDGFPLASGWPDDSEAEPGADLGLEGPSRSLPELDLQTACGVPVPDLAHLDRLGARWANIEDGRARQLTLYGTPQEAAAAMSGMVGAYRACPVAPEREDGFVTETEVREVSAGDEGWAVLESDTFDGAPSTFGETTVLVRVGAAVLVVVHSGHGGNPQPDPQGNVDAVVEEAERVVAAMSDLAG